MRISQKIDSTIQTSFVSHLTRLCFAGAPCVVILRYRCMTWHFFTNRLRTAETRRAVRGLARYPTGPLLVVWYLFTAGKTQSARRKQFRAGLLLQRRYG